MKKFFSVLMLASILVLGGAGVAMAVEEPDDKPLPDSENVQTGADVISRIGTASNWVFAIMLAISVIFLLMAGFEFVTGQGDPEKMAGARQKLIYAAVGIAVALVAQGFDDVIRNIVKS